MKNYNDQDSYTSDQRFSTKSTKKRSAPETRISKRKKRNVNLWRINPFQKLITLALVLILFVLGLFGLDNTPFGEAIHSALEENVQPAATVRSENERDGVLEIRIAENSVFFNGSDVSQENLLGLLNQANSKTVYLIDARAKHATWENVQSLLIDAGFIVVPIVE